MRSAGSTWSAARGSPARASSTAWATRALLELALYRFALDRLVAAGASCRCCRPCSSASRRCTAPASCPTDDVNIYHVERDDLYLTGTSEVALAGAAHGARSSTRTTCRCATPATRPASAARRAPPARTRAACSASTSSTRSRCSRSRGPRTRARSTSTCSRSRRSSSQELGIPYRVVNVAAGDLGASAAKKYDIEALVPGPAALPRDHLDLEHDRLPGPAARRSATAPASAAPSSCTR